MPQIGAARALIAFGVSVLAVSTSRAQDALDVQPMVDRVLFAAQSAAAEKKAAERRQVEALDRQAQQQAITLQEQASAVKQLSSELQTIRDERQVLQLAEAFDAAIVSGRWSTARSLLADSVAVDLAGFSNSGASVMSPDTFISSLANSLAAGGVLPRSNQNVRIEGDRAILYSQGYAWRQSGRPVPRVNQSPGRYEYRFQRSAEGWKLDGLSFQPIAD